VAVNLTGVANAQTITVTVSGVSNGTNSTDVAVPMSILRGDTSGNRSVTSTDIGQVKSQSGQAVAADNFRADVTSNGSINSSDIGVVKANSGSSLP
jgi:hypothetical protein